MTTKIPAANLQSGDYLPMTKSTVVSNLGAGLRTPAGKIELVLSNSKGAKRLAVWGARTEIVVERVS